jgi:hypothetical protein
MNDFRSLMNHWRDQERTKANRSNFLMDDVAETRKDAVSKKTHIPAISAAKNEETLVGETICLVVRGVGVEAYVPINSMTTRIICSMALILHFLFCL